jgi:hypothetical protein
MDFNNLQLLYVVLQQQGAAFLAYMTSMIWVYFRDLFFASQHLFLKLQLLFFTMLMYLCRYNLFLFAFIYMVPLAGMSYCYYRKGLSYCRGPNPQN